MKSYGAFMRKVMKMSNTFDSLIRDVCKQAWENDIVKLEQFDFSDTPVRPLTADEIQKLAQKITALPLEYMNTLFFRYCFGFSSEDADAVLETAHSAGRLRYTRNMLSHFMGLDGAVVDDHSMKMACETALLTYVVQDVPDVLQIPKYSSAFRRTLKAIKAAQKSTTMVITLMKRVAVFILVCAISFSTALVANAKLRERFLNWVVETFPKFSIFTTQTTESPVAMVLSQDDIVFGYLPEGYRISDVSQGRNMLKYNFLSDDENNQLTISFIVSKAGIKSYFNTEDAEVQCISIKNSEAYTWKTDKMTYLLWAQGDIKCQMFGNLDNNELIKIAENVEF
ncbi:MAG: hypothetical protein K0S22_979 [Oscillospiraceae bacterium]|nr:hypothetical protein [Oscillospiraceae bacterium]